MTSPVASKIYRRDKSNNTNEGRQW
jgi:hypothetical protein